MDNKDIDKTSQKKIDIFNEDEPQKESLIEIIYKSQNEVNDFFEKRKARLGQESCQ